MRVFVPSPIWDTGIDLIDSPHQSSVPWNASNRALPFTRTYGSFQNWPTSRAEVTPVMSGRSIVRVTEMGSVPPWYSAASSKFVTRYASTETERASVKGADTPPAASRTLPLLSTTRALNFTPDWFATCARFQVTE